MLLLYAIAFVLLRLCFSFYAVASCCCFCAVASMPLINGIAMEYGFMLLLCAIAVCFHRQGSSRDAIRMMNA